MLEQAEARSADTTDLIGVILGIRTPESLRGARSAQTRRKRLVAACADEAPIVPEDLDLGGATSTERAILIALAMHAAMHKEGDKSVYTCRLSHGKIGAMTGLSRPQVTRKMRSLVDRNFVSVLRGRSGDSPIEYQLLVDEWVRKGQPARA